MLEIYFIIFINILNHRYKQIKKEESNVYPPVFMSGPNVYGQTKL